MRALKWGLILGLALPVVYGCDDNGDENGEDAGRTDGGPMVDVDGGDPPLVDGGPDEDGGDPPEDGGPPASECDDDAEAFCGRFEECDPANFRFLYENQTICRRVTAEACENPAPPIPHANGLVDEDACEAMRVGSCEGFFATGALPTPEACRLQPGDIVDSTPMSCFDDSQCGIVTAPGDRMTRSFCRPFSGMLGAAGCPRGTCIATWSLDTGCTGSGGRCNTFEDQHCLQEFDADEGVTGQERCRQVEYGMGGAACFPGTNRQCASGFACHTENRVCMAVLAEGVACDPDEDLCDRRRGEVCMSLGAGPVCARPNVVVAIGAQCGMVGDMPRERVCSQYADCDDSLATPVCVAKRELGQTCTLDPDNCEPGLECDSESDTCQVPEPVDPCE